MFVLMNPETNRIVARYPTERGAKIARTRKFPTAQVMDEAVYNVGFRKQVAVKNLMSGKEVMIDINEVGGCCDPSTERYWSM
jgi:hypothetical protein